MIAQLHTAARVVAGRTGALGLGRPAPVQLATATAAAGYGVRTTADNPYLAVKGIRDLGTGLTVLGLLARKDTRALGPALVTLSVIPVGDAIVVHRHGGPLSTSLGSHGATAVAMLAAGAVLSQAAQPATR